jgi:hypothetical protein
VPRGLLSTPPAFALRSPLGGELWPVDSTVTVAWVTGQLGGSIAIDLSRSGSAGPWSSLLDSTANDGQEDVVVSGPPSPTCWLRIRYLGSPARSDSSDSSFVISAAQNLLAENFETNAPQWTHTTPGGTWSDQWHLSNTRWHSDTTSYKCGDTGSGTYGTRLDAQLLSPMIYNLPPNSMLSFWHWLDAEVLTAYGSDSANDGGLLEVSANGGPFTQIFPEIGGYNSMIRRGATPSGPFTRGTQVWSGPIRDWVKVTARLAAFAGDSVQFRFRFGTNSSNGREGWYVDDVNVFTPLTIQQPDHLTCYRVGNEVQLRWHGAGPHYAVYSSPSADGPFTLLEHTDQTTVTVSSAADSLKFFMVKAWDGNAR